MTAASRRSFKSCVDVEVLGDCGLSKRDVEVLKIATASLA
jgi:hypothetical protein